MVMSFSYIQSNTLLPIFYAEVTSAPEPISPNLRMLLIGYKNRGTGYDEGTADDNTLYPVTREEAVDLFGPGSMLSWMYEKARLNAPRAEIWCISIPEAGSAIRAVHSIDVVNGGSRVRNGIASVSIGGRKVDVKVDATDTAAAIATKLKSNINVAALPVRATIDVGTPATVTLTCKWAGRTGSEITLSYIGPHGRADSSDAGVRFSRYLFNLNENDILGDGEDPPAGALAALGERPFDVFGFPHTGQANLDACQDFMDASGGRWSPFSQLYGHMFTTKIDTYSAFTTLGPLRNDPHMSMMAVMKSTMPSWEWTASLCGVVVTHWAAPPELSRPLQTLELRGMYVGGDVDDSFIASERQILLEQGFSTFHVDPDTTCRIDRIRTMRKTNLYGDPDPSWADAITMFQAMYLVRSMRRMITGNFPRAALTTDLSPIPGFASPALIRLAIIQEYIRLQTLGLVENANLFAQYLVVERDPVDRNRVNVLMRPDFVNQLRVVAVIVETHLELAAGDVLITQTAA